MAQPVSSETPRPRPTPPAATDSHLRARAVTTQPSSLTVHHAVFQNHSPFDRERGIRLGDREVEIAPQDPCLQAVFIIVGIIAGKFYLESLLLRF